MFLSSIALPRPFARLAVVALAVLSASVATAGTASAHVTVSTQDAAPGGFGKVTFRVPNESDTASTVGLRIQIPQDAALASLRTQPLPGWTATLTTSNLAEPIENHGQEISSYVSVVEFRAETGGGIRPGEFQEFALSGGPFPEADRLAFPAVQLYSDGSETAWIEPSVDGRAEPERPAPVLALEAGAGGTLDEPAGDPETATGASGDHGHEADSEPAGLALFVAILALLTGIGGVVLGWRATRRTVSS
jgi:uncharacterized protein YcnI